MRETLYLIWSIEHKSWWAADERGYVNCRRSAGRYKFEQACRIVEGANIGLHNIPNEAMVPLEESEYE